MDDQTTVLDPPDPAHAIDLESITNTEDVEPAHESHVNPPALPALRAGRGRTKLKFKIGVLLVIMDLAVLPIVYFYALRFGTSLDLQLSRLRNDDREDSMANEYPE